MGVYSYVGLYEKLEEDIESIDKLQYGSEDWKRVQDSIDKRYNTTLAEARLTNELAEKEARLELEREKAERDAELRELEAEVADKKSKREFIGKIVGIIAGIGIVGAKLIYDNSDAITDKFTLDAGSKMISGK